MSYPILAQRDVRWKDKSIGYSSETVGVSGCLFMSLLMMVCRDQPFLPAYIDSFMGCLNGHSNYTQGGAAYLQSFDVSACRPVEWGPCVCQNPQARSYIGEDMPASELAALVAWLKSGQSALIEVDDRGPAATNVKLTHRDHQHFVLGVGINAAGAIIVHDPWHGDEATLVPRYGPTNEFAIYRAILYKTVATPAKIPKLTITPDKIAAGKSAVIAWSDTDGASAIRLNSAGVTGPSGNKTVAPGATTKYTLTITYPDGAVTTLEQTLTVTSAPAKPHRAASGDHVLANGGFADWAVSKGRNVVTVMNDEVTAARLATGDPMTWTPDSPYPLVFYRQYHETNPWSPSQMIAQLGGILMHNNPNVCISLENEWDNGIPGASNTADGMNKFLDWSLECVRQLKARGFPNVVVLNSSMGTPDFTNQAVCDVIKSKLAPEWNNGNVRWLGPHLYSPTPEWIYKTIPSSFAMSAPRIIRGIVGRDKHEATWVDYALSARSAEMVAELATFNDSPTYQDWFETRWHFYFTRCGLSPTAPGWIVCLEWGLDEGGAGGFKAHGWTRAQVQAYNTRLLDLQSAPMVINGISYPSRFKAGTYFQLGDRSTEKGHWGGYDMADYEPL